MWNLHQFMKIKSELKITPRENPLKDFFGKDININAIVGENGSGKSSILELLAEIFRIEFNKNRNLIVDNNHTFDFFLVFKIKDKTYKIKNQKSLKVLNLLFLHLLQKSL